MGASTNGEGMLAVDLFCGAGGFSLGMQQAGWMLTGAYDHWEPALETYKRNIAGGHDHAHSADCAYLDEMISRIEEDGADIVFGGPPCQDFSNAKMSTAKNRGDKAKLTICFAYIVATVKPQYVCFENVPPALAFEEYQQALDILKGAGYTLRYPVFRASHYGVAQRRDRRFCFGSLDPTWPDRVVNLMVAKANRREPTVRDALLDHGIELVAKHYYHHPNGATDRRRVVQPMDQPAKTLTTSQYETPTSAKTLLGHQYEISPGASLVLKAVGAELHDVALFGSREFQAIQGFPKEWGFPNHQSQYCRVKQLANAVPPPLAKAVGESMLEAHQGEDARFALGGNLAIDGAVNWKMY